MCDDRGRSSVTETGEGKGGRKGWRKQPLQWASDEVGRLLCGGGVCVWLVLSFLAEVAFPSFSALVERKRLLIRLAEGNLNCRIP